MKNKKGKFIVLAGGEGSGKTTLIKDFLIPRFGKENFFWTREPGGSSFGEKIRNLILDPEAKSASILTNFFLHFASRATHISLIADKLKNDLNVISDRGDCCTFAYQIYGQKEKYLEKYFWQTREVVFKEMKPDLYIFLDIEPKIGLKRVLERGENKTHYDSQSLDYHKRVREGYKTFMKKVPSKIIDASNSKQEVAEEAIKIIEERLLK